MFGNDQQYSLEGHQFAVFGFCLTSDLRYIVSISNKFITWDLSTSDMTRDVNPGIEGIMQQLVLSPDNRFAAAYTNNNQVSYFAECCSHKTKYCTVTRLLVSVMCSFMQYTDSALMLSSLSCYLELHSQFNDYDTGWSIKESWFYHW